MKQRLMVVEDNPDLLDIYELCFKQGGLNVLAANDGEKALKHYIQFQPQVVLCDIKMPNLSGFDVIEIMNAYPKLRKKTDVVVMSAYDSSKMRTRAKRLGVRAEHYLVKSQITLVKPCKLYELFSAVKSLDKR